MIYNRIYFYSLDYRLNHCNVRNGLKINDRFIELIQGLVPSSPCSRMNTRKKIKIKKSQILMHPKEKKKKRQEAKKNIT